MATVIQGEQYAIEIVVTADNTPITPTNCDDIKIKLGDTIRKYSAGELMFEDNAWLFPLTQEQTLRMSGVLPLQVQYKVGDNIFSTTINGIDIGKTIIKEMW